LLRQAVLVVALVVQALAQRGLRAKVLLVAMVAAQLTVLLEVAAVQVLSVKMLQVPKAAMVAQAFQAILQAHGCFTLVAAVAVYLTLMALRVLAVRVVAVMQQQADQARVRQVLQILVVAAVGAVTLVDWAQEVVAMVAQASLLFPTQAHNVAQAAQLHRQVVTQFTHLQRLAHTPHKDHHGTFCKNCRR
jgi:hypothetical protein